MMNIQIKALLAIAVMLVIFSSAPAYAVVIGDWEGTPDGSLHWPTGHLVDDPNVMPSIYNYESTYGVTNGSQSLKMTTGTGTTYEVYQYLALDLNYDQRVAFLQNDRFSIDYSVQPGTAGGRMQIYNIILNADGLGWNSVIDDVTSTADQLYFDMWSGSPSRTMTLSFDYDASELSEIPGYVQIIFEVQDGGSAEPYFYWDNARLLNISGTVGSYDHEIMVDSPVLYLRLEEDTPVDGGSGNGDLTDSSVNGYWAVHRADTQFVADGGIGNCRFLPAIPDDPNTPDTTEGNQNAIAAGNTTEFDWTFDFSDDHAFAPDDITFEFWFNTTAQTDTDANGLGAYAVFFQQVKAELDQAPGMGNSDGNFRVLTGQRTISDPNETEFWWYPGVEVPTDGQWHQVVLTYDESYGGDENAMQIQLYLDGEFRNSTIVGDATWPARLGPEFDHVCIGGVNDLGWTYNDYYGLIDEFAIYEGILSADRIGIHYGAGLCAMSKGDVTGDCKVNLEDFAVIASDWLRCNVPDDPECEENWLN